jgi:hypothetical protein
MENLGLAILGAGLGTGLIWIAVQTWTAARVRTKRKDAFFDDCACALTAPRTGIGSSGFPRLAGKYRGLEVDLQAVLDTLTFRKLPALWVLITLPGPMPLRATLDMMIRPTGVEPFSNFHQLPDQISIPAGFPDDCTIRTEDASAMLAEAVLVPHLGLFDRERVKELVISPKGLRVVLLAEEANRGRYLIFRDAEVGRKPLPAAQITPLLDALVALRADILALGSRDSQNSA